MNNEQGSTVNYQKCIVIYSTEDEQEPVVKQPQKVSKISTDEDPQETSPALVKPAKIPNFVAASCTYILTKGERKGKQCRLRASDEAGKFCHHHKQTPN